MLVKELIAILQRLEPDTPCAIEIVQPPNVEIGREAQSVRTVRSGFGDPLVIISNSPNHL